MDIHDGLVLDIHDEQPFERQERALASDDSRPEGMRWKVTKAVRASDLPSPAKLVMLVLADIADVGTAEIPERFTPSLTVLAKETSLGRSTVAMHLNSLEEKGWIVRTRPTTADSLGRGERTRYQLTIPSPGDGLVQELDGPGDGLPSAGDGPANPAPGLPSAGAGHRDRSSSDLDQISSDPSSSAEPPKAEPIREDVERVCNYLAEWIVKNGSKRPTITKKWRDAARLLIDNDGATLEEIRETIAWSQRNEFWRANILSMPTLRKQYARLRLSAQRGQKPQSDQREYNGLMLNERTIADLERRDRFAAMDAALTNGTKAIEGRAS